MEWYNAIADSYDELYSEEQIVKYELVTSNLSKDVGTVLDVGCGSGLFLEYLFLRGFNIKYYVCLDVSLGLIKLALSRSGNVNFPTDFIIADMAYPPLREGWMFSLVTMITVLKDCYDVKKIIEKYKRFLRNGGRLIYTVLTRGYTDDNMRYERLDIIVK